MKRNFIIDQEIKLEKGTDFLNTKTYSDTLRKMICNVPHDKPFTIGLFGEWGSGKSSIIKTTCEELQQTDFKAKFVVFDAWKYAEDAFRRSFIVSISQKLDVELDKRQYNLYANITEQINELKLKIKLWVWLVILIIPLVMICLYLTNSWFEKNILYLVSLISISLITPTVIAYMSKAIEKGWLSKFIGVINTMIHSKYSVEKPLMFSPEQFSSAFDEIVDKATTDLDKLIIVIDNIDRCEKKYATELLSTIKGFLESRTKVLFILPVDETALKRHVIETHRANDKEADEFLRKFFNVTLRIKPYHTTEIYDFAKSINQKYSLSFTDYTLDLVSKEYASNPRRIIQIFNNLSTELECFEDPDFAKEFETVICKLLILREEFPEYYNRLSKNPYLLHPSPEETIKHDENKPRQELWNFLNKTKVITASVSLSSLNKILSNSKVFSTLPFEIESYIENLQINELKKFIDNDSQRYITVINYLIQQLALYRERNLIKSSFINSLDMLIELNFIKELDLVINKRVEEIISDVLGGVISEKSSLDNLIPYSWAIKLQGRTYFSDQLTLILTHALSDIKPQQKYIDAFIIAINTYDDVAILKKLEIPFGKLYMYDNILLTKVELNVKQVNNLVSDSLMAYIIENVSSFDTENRFLDDLKFILGKRKSSKQIESDVISKIRWLFPNFTGKATIEITKAVGFINSFLILIKHGFSNQPEQLQGIADLVLQNRKIPSIQYPNHRDYDSNVSYVDECISGAGNINALLDFCLNIYRLTANAVNINDVLIKIIANSEYQELLNDKLSKCLTNNISLKGLFDVILSDKIYSNTSLLLLKHALTSKQNEIYELDDEKLDNKLRELLNLLYEEDARKLLIDSFLIDLANDKRIKGQLAIIIPDSSQENILKLSPLLQALAINAVLLGDAIFEYKDNLGFLKVIAKNGLVKHTEKLRKVIVSKLQRTTQVEDAKSIILELRHLSANDAKLIISELQSQPDGDGFKEVIKHIEKIKN
jgi:nucleoside-triphosphatase THEP1